MTGYESKKAAARDKVAQPAQEPVDDVRGFLAARLTCWYRLTEKESDELVALFEVKPPQRPWVGLTDEEMLSIEETTTCTKDESWLRNVTRAIEAKLKENNNG